MVMGDLGIYKKTLSIRDQMTTSGVLPDIYTYNALIYALTKEGKVAEANSLKTELVLNGFLPDVVTYNLLIAAARNFGQIHIGLLLHNEMLRKGYNPDIVAYTQLIKGYCLRCETKDAEKLFDKI